VRDGFPFLSLTPLNDPKYFSSLSILLRDSTMVRNKNGERGNLCLRNLEELNKIEGETIN
jgi:hypothetical protein